MTHKYLYIHGSLDLLHDNKTSYHLSKLSHKQFDMMSIAKINTEILQKYKVVCIDHYATHRSIPRYLNMFANVSTKKILLICDLHEYTFGIKYDKKIHNDPLSLPGEGVAYLHKQLKKGDINYILSYCNCQEFDNIKSMCTNSYINNTLSFHVPINIFKDYKQEKIIDILFVGTYSSNAYRFRYTLVKLLNSLQKKYKIVVKNNIKYGPELSQLINKSWLTIATQSNFGYLVKKYFEISASNSVILGDMPKDGIDIWEDNYVHIDRNMNNNRIIEIIDNALENKNILSKKADIMYHKIHNEYNYDKYAEKMFNFFNKVEGHIE